MNEWKGNVLDSRSEIQRGLMFSTRDPINSGEEVLQNKPHRKENKQENNKNINYGFQVHDQKT